MNVMVVGLLAVAAYFVVVAVWMKLQDRHQPTGQQAGPPDQGSGTS